MTDRADDDQFDGLYFTLAQKNQGIDNLLESFFGFLRRKTDYFTGASNSQMEESLLGVLRRQRAISEKETLKKAKAKAAEEQKRMKKKELAAGDGATEDAAEGAAGDPQELAAGDGATEDAAEGAAGDDDEDNAPAPVGNGGKTSTYEWTQTLQELSVVVKVPAGSTSRDVICDITKSKLRVGIKGQALLVNGNLFNKVKVDESFWTLEDGAEISIALQKENQMQWWKCVIEGDPEINTSKVQPENSKLGDLDGETRKTVEKMMFDQRQKAQGLPTADEMNKQEMLKKFMSQHPEMDFSKAKIS